MQFKRYIGIDYSGAKTPVSSLSGLRVYRLAADSELPPVEVPPSPRSLRKYWTRRGVAEWLEKELLSCQPTLVGIDHGFSFPTQYFDRYGSFSTWKTFLEDFQDHWPTGKDENRVQCVRNGRVGNQAARHGDSRWRRLTEERVRAKSVFHFDVPGAVAKSTHSGLPWLLHLKSNNNSVHFWPFDGWKVSSQASVIAEVYPALCNHTFDREDRTPDQHDAYSIARWMRERDKEGTLRALFQPHFKGNEQKRAKIEGWILGIP